MEYVCSECGFISEDCYCLVCSGPIVIDDDDDVEILERNR
jgi:hypothetical protein